MKCSVGKQDTNIVEWNEGFGIGYDLRVPVLGAMNFRSHLLGRSDLL
jgi:hypothetical protein